MTEIRDHKYIPIGADHRVFVRTLIPAAELSVGTPFSRGLLANFQGFARQGFKIVVNHAGGGPFPIIEVRIQERHNGIFVTKANLGILGVGTPTNNQLFEHNSADMMGETRVELTPTVAVPDGGIFVEINGRRTV